MTRKEERLLLNALGNSDRKAFAVLYNLYAGKCLHFVASVLKDDEVSKDRMIFWNVWSIGMVSIFPVMMSRRLRRYICL